MPSSRRYTKKEIVGGNASTSITMYPLNPHLFMPRPSLQDWRLEKRTMHRPFWIHANWAGDDVSKMNIMKAEKVWLLQSE